MLDFINTPSKVVIPVAQTDVKTLLIMDDALAHKQVLRKELTL